MTVDLSTKTIGRRKEAVIQAKLTPGNGTIVVNGQPLKDYFPVAEYQNLIKLPFEATSTGKNFDVNALAKGGGKRGQADALRLAIARALVKENIEFRAILKKLGYLSRDARVKERKKYGHKKARRSPQWSKR
ncbi:MAG: 30S ribosomal protein S9 [Candidatus Uhrbacteria bacterium]